ERLIAIGLDCVRTISSGRKVSTIRAGDDRVQIRVQDVVVSIEHLEDGCAGWSCAVYWIDSVVVKNRLAVGRLHRRAVGVLLRREREIFFSYLAAIPFSATRLDVYRAEESHRQGAAIAFAAGGCGGAVDQKVTFFLGVQRVGDAVAGRDETARVCANV